MEGILDTVVLVFTVIFGLASVLVPDYYGNDAKTRRYILLLMALALVCLTIWQQSAGAKLKHQDEADRQKEVSALNSQIGSLNVQVTSLQSDLGAAKEAAKSQAPLEPAILRSGIPTIGQYEASELSVSYKFQNHGQLPAKEIVTYSATQLGDWSDEMNSRLQTFNGLADKIGGLRRANQGTTIRGELSFLGVLPVNASSGPLSSEDLQALKAKHKSLYVMFYVDYKNSRGGSQVGVFCDSWGGDPAQPGSCPGNWRDYYEIIKDKSIPN